MAVNDVRTAEVAIQAVQNMIGGAHWRLNYHQWLDRIGAEDDDYWQEKWSDWQTLVQSISKFDAHTLAKICQP